MHKAITLVGVALLLGTASLALAEVGTDPVASRDYAKGLATPEAALAYVVVYGATTEDSDTQEHAESGSYVNSDESLAHFHSEECVAHSHSEGEDGDH
ncbi:MAG: hypothetical protein OXS33_05905, partial [bacterium]|nr:hypothetical protein [bacterium]MDE0499760.1 hypothetical protein [bacterium]